MKGTEAWRQRIKVPGHPLEEQGEMGIDVHGEEGALHIP